MNSESEKLNKLRERISENEDVLLFDEAVKCLTAGAHRAAYIVTWICVAEALRNRFMSMSLRDAEIGKIVGQIKDCEKNDRPTDKLLLGKASELGIVMTDEEEKLEHMRVMRNIYAHPTGVGPSEEEVVAALTIAIEAVLSKPALMRHGYVQNLFRSLFEDFHFLDDVPVRIREYAEGVVHRVHPEVLPYLLENLFERLEQSIYDPELALFMRRGIEFGTALLATLQPTLSEEKWNIIQTIQKCPMAGSLLLASPTMWSLLPEQAQDMVLGHLTEPIRDNQIQPPTIIGLQLVCMLDQASLPTKRQKERIASCIKRASYSTLSGAGIHLSEYAQRIKQDLANHNWHTQNPACDALLNAGKNQCGQLDKDTQEQLGRNVLQAADGTATHAVNFIRQIIQSEEVWSRHFIEGMLLETLVNEKQDFRLKERHFGGALIIVSKHPKASSIFNRLIKEVTKSKPKYHWTGEFDKAINLISTIRPQIDPDAHQYLEALENGIVQAKSQVTNDEDDF